MAPPCVRITFIAKIGEGGWETCIGPPVAFLVLVWVAVLLGPAYLLFRLARAISPVARSRGAGGLVLFWIALIAVAVFVFVVWRFVPGPFPSREGEAQASLVSLGVFTPVAAFR